MTYDEELDEAFAPQSVVLTLNDEIDISRGDMIVRKNNLPQVSGYIEAMICWMDEQPLSMRESYILKHTTRSVRAFVSRILYKNDVDTMHRERGVETLALNEIGRVEIRTALPIFFDPYKVNHGTGSFILIDPLTNNTVAAGMIRGAVKRIDDLIERTGVETATQKKSPHTIWSDWNIAREMREMRYSHKGAVLWLTGYSGSGKSTIARNLEKKLFEAGCQTMLLDGDNIRHGLCGDLGFSDKDRSENIRRVGEVARLFFEAGHIVVCTFISPFEKDRAFVRLLFPAGSFFEVYVKCDLEVCRRRDPNGLYQKAFTGEIKDFTGVSSPYEAPCNPEITLKTDLQSVEDSVARIIDRLKLGEIIKD
jgi:bifunctional enzyme CysN/CysC